jgi:hypothetical protein
MPVRRLNLPPPEKRKSTYRTPTSPRRFPQDLDLPAALARVSSPPIPRRRQNRVGSRPNRRDAAPGLRSRLWALPQDPPGRIRARRCRDMFPASWTTSSQQVSSCSTSLARGYSSCVAIIAGWLLFAAGHHRMNRRH